MSKPLHKDFLIPIGGAWLDSRIPAIARRLQERDRDLEIRAYAGKNRDRIQQYEVYWRDQFIARFLPSEVDMIESEMAMLDRTNPNHVETVDRLDRREAERQRDATRHFHDVYMGMLEHNARLEAELEFGKTFHGQAGYGDSPIEKKK